MKFPDSDTEFHFMVDIETLSLRPNALITEIGAAGIFEDVSLHLNCYDESAVFDVDPETVKWRMARKLTWDAQAMSIREAIEAFNGWIETNAKGREPFLWCKGTDFDLTILRFAYDFLGLKTPWKYNNTRDMRTVLSFFPEHKIPEEMKPHKGLADAWNQCAQLSHCLVDLRKMHDALGSS